MYLEIGKNVIYAHSLNKEDYYKLSKVLEIDEKRIKDVINEEIFTPRILKTNWEMYKLYYPAIISEKKEEFTWYKILPLVIYRKENKVVIIEENYFEKFYEYVEKYVEFNNVEVEKDQFLLGMLHSISQSLYKHIRMLIEEHDKIEIVLREQQSNEKLISLAEVEQGFYIYNIALRNLNYIIENLLEEEEFKVYEDYITKILQEINFTLDLSSSYFEICKTTRETYSSYIDTNMNITMKFLTAATILITIPNMIFGFYGMNVLLPFQDKGFLALGIIVVLIIVLMVILWKYMKKKIL